MVSSSILFLSALPFRTISLCLRVRLRLLTAGLLLLRAAGGTAEEAAAAAAAAKEGGGVGGGGLGTSSSSGPAGGRSYNTRSSSSSSSSVGRGQQGAGGEESSEGSARLSARLSRQARLKLLRRACGTLRELDALEEALYARRRSGGGGSGSGIRSRGGKRGPGASLGDGDGGLEGEGDRVLRAHIVETCVSIIEEMFIPRAYMAAGGGVEGAEWQGEEEGGVGGGIGPMGPEVERIVREEKVRTPA